MGQLARDTLERSFQGKTAVTRRALSPLASIRDKLDGLAFSIAAFGRWSGDRSAGRPGAGPGPIANGVLAALTQFFSLAAQPDGLRTWAANASVWQAPQEFLGLPDPSAAPPSSSRGPDADGSGPGTPIDPAPEPVSASTVDADAPASIEDTETRRSPPTPVDRRPSIGTPKATPTVDAAADPLTVPFEGRSRRWWTRSSPRPSPPSPRSRPSNPLRRPSRRPTTPGSSKPGAFFNPLGTHRPQGRCLFLLEVPHEKNALLGALPIIATLLGQKLGVKVVIGGRQAITDGQTIVLPSLPADGDPVGGVGQRLHRS